MRKLLFLILLLTCCVQYSIAGRCTGSANCSACRNCSACKHCAVGGGTCGVCSGSDSDSYQSNKTSGAATTNNASHFFIWLAIGLIVFYLIQKKRDT